MKNKYDLLINGKYVKSSSGKYFPIENPSNLETVAECAQANITDVQSALEAADIAFQTWKKTSARERCEILHKGASQIREKIPAIAELLTKENGKPLNDSIKEIKFSADVIDYYAEEARRLSGITLDGDGQPTFSVIIKQPIGVVGAICPYNFPVDIMAWKIGPALSVGCTIVIKLSPDAPLAAFEFANCFQEVGLPPGVMNLLFGFADVGEELVKNSLSRKISFTGSVATGVKIAQQAANKLKSLTLELGGSCPLIVFNDADMNLAVREAVRRRFSHTGQICVSADRIYVQKEIADEFIERFVDKVSKLRIGDGIKNPDADLGPLINKISVERMNKFLSDAIEKGAKVLCGGKQPEDPDLRKGYFYMPTVLTNVNKEMLVMSEETFGPIAPIDTFSTIEEAIEKANDSIYGLAAYIYTNNIDIAMKASKEIEAGGVGVNNNNTSTINAPFGGWKMSGVGRELGQVGLDAYLEYKHILIREK